MTTSRRGILASLLAGSLGLAPRRGQAAAPAALAPTPACTDRAERTAAQTEGPYFSPGSPMRHDLGPT